MSSSTLANHLTYNSSKTATEVVSEQDTTETSVNNKRDLANVAINEMLSDVAYFYGYENDELTIEWGRAAANSARENQELMTDYQAGTLPLKTYLRKRWTDLSEEEVDALAIEIEAERKKLSREKSQYGSLFNDSDYYGDQSKGGEM